MADEEISGFHVCFWAVDNAHSNKLVSAVERPPLGQPLACPDAQNVLLSIHEFAAGHWHPPRPFRKRRIPPVPLVVGMSANRTVSTLVVAFPRIETSVEHRKPWV